VRAVVRSVTALTSAAVLAGAGQLWTLQQQFDADVVTSRAAIPSPRATPAGTEFTALLVGLDARTDANGDPLPPALLDALHAGPDEGQLHTDTIILLRVPAAAGEPAVAISIPRDSFVPIAGDRGTHKINSAYGRGVRDAENELRDQGATGADLDRRAREAGRRTLVATVEELTGASVDHYAEINMAGFVELTEALGGVPVCLNAPVRDSYSGVDLPAGPHVVSGAGALAFVRQRHGLADGDLDRIARQQAFAAGLAQRLMTAGTLADAVALQRLVGVVTRHVVLDAGWDLDQAMAQIRRLSGDDLRFHTIPTGRPDLRTPVDGIAVEIDRDAVREFVQATLTGPRTGTAPAATPDPTASTGPTTTHPTSAAPTAVPRTGSPQAPVTVQPARTPRTSGAAPETSTPPVITADGVPCVD
jgi:LCP family protein required for cell wall assembly